jgi:hypothetical protein
VVRGDPQNPRGNAGLLAKGLKALEHAQKCHLRDIFGILSMLKNPLGQPEDTPLVPSDQLLKRSELARTSPAK